MTEEIHTEALSTSVDESGVPDSEEVKQILSAISTVDQLDLSEGEISGIVNELSRIMPAGDIPGVIASGLARLKERHIWDTEDDPKLKSIRSKIKPLMDRLTYLGVFAGPASAIWVYQSLLERIGKNENAAFPDGLWQFYCEYALREDTARHANESCGFDTILTAHDIHLDRVDRSTAWVMAAVHCLHQYDDLLANEWRERMYTHMMQKVTRDLEDAGKFSNLYREWRKEVPYFRGSDVAFEETYPEYRRRKFDNFFFEAIKDLPASYQTEWQSLTLTAEETDLPLYQRQMTILSNLVPGEYRENRQFIELKDSKIAIIYQGIYYFLPTCQESGEPIDVNTVREIIATIYDSPLKGHPFQLTFFPSLRRNSLTTFLRETNNPEIEKLSTLDSVPIIINLDQRDPNLSLTALRHAERGLGSHTNCQP